MRYLRFNKSGTKEVGTILLCVWLIITGLMQLVIMPIPSAVMAVIAIAAGTLILIDRYYLF